MRQRDKIFGLVRVLGLGALGPLIETLGEETLKEQLIQIVAKIPPEYQPICQAYYGIDGVPLNDVQIANRWQRAVGYVTNQLLQARRQMRKTLEYAVLKRKADILLRQKSTSIAALKKRIRELEAELAKLRAERVSQ